MNACISRRFAPAAVLLVTLCTLSGCARPVGAPAALPHPVVGYAVPGEATRSSDWQARFETFTSQAQRPVAWGIAKR